MSTIEKDRKERWRAAQAKEDAFWKRDGVWDGQVQRVRSRYGPVLVRLSEQLTPDARILDVGCGPTCAAQLFPVGSKTYLDPLMDSYLETYADGLPEGKKIAAAAESIPEPDESFDVVLCVNALDHVIEPEKVLLEIHRVLKKDALLVLGIFLHPAPIAAARIFIERWLPFLREEAHPYSYTVWSIRRLLGKFFSVERGLRVFRNSSSRLPSLHREDWIFICRKAAVEQ